MSESNYISNSNRMFFFSEHDFREKTFDKLGIICAIIRKYLFCPYPCKRTWAHCL